jgi:acyl-CoA thioesterase I
VPLRRAALRWAMAHASALGLGVLGSVAFGPMAYATAAPVAATMPVATPATGPLRTLLVVGDSLSAEYGLARGQGWVALLEKRLKERRSDIRADGKAGSTAPWQVVNASISGDTTSGGRSRLPALLAQHKPALVVLELGGNDALRGLPLAMTEANLTAMARAAKAAGAKVLVVGIAVPPNYGRQYGEDFYALFGKVARAEGAALAPFLLAGVADGPEPEALFQADRIHPKAQAHPRMLENVWGPLAPLLSHQPRGAQ